MLLRKNTKVEMLRKVPLFAHCSKKELEAIAGLADELHLEEGRELIREGQRGHEFFVIVEGDVVVRRKGRKIGTSSGGDFVGEMALVTGRPRNATVTAATPVRTLVVTAQAFQRLLETSPTIQNKVLRALAERVPDDGA
jgi:CRP/FNR family transcriptional regulator, cyclic AMP receptor protein